MRALLPLSILLLGCGGAAVVSAPSEPVAPETQHSLPPVATIEAWLATTRIGVERPTSPPAVPAEYTQRDGDGASTWTSEDGRIVITRYDHGVFVVARLQSAPPPPGLRPRLMPALHGGRWPHHVVVIDGWDTAVPIEEAGPSAWRVPLRQVGAGTLDATARLIHHSDAANDGAGFLNYGAIADLRAADGRDIPGGWSVHQSSQPRGRPDATQWGQARAYEDASVPLSIQTARLESSGSWTRISLRQGERLTTAFEFNSVSDLDEFEFYEGRVSAVDGMLLVHFTVQGWSHYFSVHDPESGQRIGEAVAVGPSAIGEAHGSAPSFEAIMGDGEITGFVLPAAEDPLLFDAPGQPGRFVPNCPSETPPGDDPDDQADDDYDDYDDYEEQPYLSGSPYYRTRTLDGVPCLQPGE